MNGFMNGDGWKLFFAVAAIVCAIFGWAFIELLIYIVSSIQLNFDV